LGSRLHLSRIGSVKDKAAVVMSIYRIITQRELRDQSAAVLREVEAGRTIVVSRNGTPVAELRPIQSRRFVLRATLAEAVTRAPRVDAARFRADLDAVTDRQLDD
jgi:prevent-host-death family protein